MEKMSRKQNISQFLQFTLFSISAGIVQVLTFTLFEQLFKLPYWPSYLTALVASVVYNFTGAGVQHADAGKVASVVYNFTVNRRFTFKSSNNIPKAMIQLGLYYAIFTPLSTWWGDALVSLGWNDYIVLGGTMIINFITEFMVNRLIIYRTSMNTRKQR